MSQVDRYKPYKGAAAGWGALIAVTKTWLGSENALKISVRCSRPTRMAGLLVKTEGMLESRMRLFTRPLAWLLLAVFGGLAVLALLALFGLLKTLRQRHTHWPFAFTLMLVFLGYIGLAFSVWPNIVPPSISLWAAASPATSQLFILIGALFILPIILMYTVWSYYVFCGKVRIGDGYH
jgi:cytochrome d ubiquinol oxidase subunit II